VASTSGSDSEWQKFSKGDKAAVLLSGSRRPPLMTDCGGKVAIRARCSRFDVGEVRGTVRELRPLRPFRVCDQDRCVASSFKPSAREMTGAYPRSLRALVMFKVTVLPIVAYS
jgi:hypothetical protein